MVMLTMISSSSGASLSFALVTQARFRRNNKVIAVRQNIMMHTISRMAGVSSPSHSRSSGPTPTATQIEGFGRAWS